MAEFVINHLTALLVAISVLVIPIYFFFLVFPSAKGKAAKKRETFGLIAVLLPLVISLIIEITPKPPPPDYESLNQPYLNPTMVIDSVSSEGIIIRYIVENVGNLPIDSIKFLCTCPGYVLSETNLPAARRLGARSHLSFRPTDVPIPLPSTKELGKFTLYALYSAKILGKEKKYTSEYDFRVWTDQVKKGPLEYERQERKDGYLSLDYQKKLVNIQDALENRGGLFAFDFRKSLQDSLNNTAFVYAKRHAVVYRPALNRIVYSYARTESMQVDLTIDLDREDCHRVTITWDGPNCALYVDNKGKEYDGRWPPKLVNLDSVSLR